MVKSMWIHNCVNQEVLGEISTLEKHLSEAMGSIRRELSYKEEGGVSTSGRVPMEGGSSLHSDAGKAGETTPSPGAESRRAEERRAKRLEELFRYCDSLQAMLEERMKRITLISSEEFSNLMQLCAKLQRSAARKVRGSGCCAWYGSWDDL
jgi:hypothetical protein